MIYEWIFFDCCGESLRSLRTLRDRGLFLVLAGEAAQTLENLEVGLG